MHFRLAALALSFLLPATSAQAEIRKLMEFGDPGDAHCHLRADAHAAQGAGSKTRSRVRQNGVQMMVPRGSIFGNAPALMYVKISYRRKNQSIEEFVSNSQKRWREWCATPRSRRSPMSSAPTDNPRISPTATRTQASAAAFRGGVVRHRLRQGRQRFLRHGRGDRQDKKAIDQAMTTYNAFLKAH